MSTTFGFQDIGIRIFEFVAKTQFLSPQYYILSFTTVLVTTFIKKRIIFGP